MAAGGLSRRRCRQARAYPERGARAGRNRQPAVMVAAAGRATGDHRNAVESWLVNKERKRAEAREDEALSISRRALLISAEANDISRSARRWAITAMLVSAVTAIVAAGITAYVQYISSGP